MRSVTKLLLFTILVASAQSAFAAKIEAVRGKEYSLTKRHGPWMIMVASLKDVPEERRMASEGGLSAQEAADELVYDLRKRGIPAYTYSTRDEFEKIASRDRVSGDVRKVGYKKQQGRIVVMAGNYNLSELEEQKRNKQEKLAKDTLAYIKKLRPAVLTDSKYGGLYRATPGRPGPLSKAFLTVNPLLSVEEIQRRKRDPLLIKLNSEMEHTLYKNPGKYTLAIASFYGTSAMHVSESKLSKLKSKLDMKAGESPLYDAGVNAWRLCEAMRKARSVGYDRNYEAYVFHDRNKSIVTVGSFDSPSDPRIAMLIRQFAAKQTTDRKTGANALAGEFFTIPRRPKPGMKPDAVWLFDPKPTVMKVPKL